MEHLARGVDLLLPSEEKQDVALRLGEVNLHDGDQRGVHVVLLGSTRVQDFHGEGAARDGEYGALEEVARKLVGVERRGGHHDLKFVSAARPAALHDALQEAEEHVRMDSALVRLIEDDHR